MTPQAKALIDKARALGYSDAELARRVGMDRSQFSRITRGIEGLPTEVAALLGDLVGVDAIEAMKRQAVENAKEPRRSMLEKVLFTLGALGVAVGLTVAVSDPEAAQLTGYTLCAVLLTFGAGQAARPRRGRGDLAQPAPR